MLTVVGGGYHQVWDVAYVGYLAVGRDVRETPVEGRSEYDLQPFVQGT